MSGGIHHASRRAVRPKPRGTTRTGATTVAMLKNLITGSPRARPTPGLRVEQ